MENLANELRSANPDLNVELLGINRMDASPFNASITLGRHLPWLQDTPTEMVWDRWGVTYRDVRILDGRNRVVAVFNLTDHDLGQPANRDALRALLLDAARLIDTDEDGLSDDWESLHFGNLAAGPGGDPDGDGYNNSAEYAFGTDPNDAASRTSFVPTVTKAGSERFFSVSFRRRAGSCLDYLLETSPDLSQWNAPAVGLKVLEPFRNLCDGTGTGMTTCTLTNAIHGRPGEFLRVRAVPAGQP